MAISSRPRARRRLLTVPAGDNVVRLLPPLIIDENDIAEAARRLDAACASLEREPATQTGSGAMTAPSD